MKINIFSKQFWRQRKAAKLEKKYRKWLNRHAPTYASGRIELVHRYTSRAGNNYYLPTDLLMLTVERKNKIEELHTALQYGLTKTDLSGFLEGIQDTLKSMPFEFANKKELSKLHGRMMMDIQELLFRCNNIKTEDILLEIALYYFFVDDEDVYTINQLTIQRKKKEALQDDDLRAFFLRTTIALLKEAASSENEDT
jgi:hypothetical protein